MKKPIVLPLIIALCTLLSGCIIDDGYHRANRGSPVDA
ncbi:hypothetical protein [Klebsiella pneumoniae]|nr:hypothetical protein [Klebsiella pneumoniae]